MKFSQVIIFIALLIPFNGDSQFSWMFTSSSGSDHLSEVEFADDTTVYIGGQNGTILKSVDAGTSWNFLYTLVPGNTGGNNDWVEGIHFISRDTGFVLLQSSEVFKTTDGGLNWSSSYYTSSNLSYGEAMDGNDNRIIFIRYDMALFTDNLGATWDSTSLNIIGAYDIDMIDGGFGFVCGQGGAAAVTSTSGSSWSPVSTGYSYDYHGVEVVSTNKIFFVADGGHMLISTDGTVFNEISMGVSNDLRNIEFANASDGILVGKGNTVYATNSGGGASGDWYPIPSTQSVDMYGVDLIDNETAVIAGDAYSIHTSPPAFDMYLIDYTGPDTLCTGVPFDFTIEIQNLGPGDAVNPVFVLLANFASFAPGGNQVYPGTLSPGNSATFTIPDIVFNTPGAYNLDLLALDDIDQVNNLVQDTIIVMDPDPITVSDPQEFCPGDTVELSATGGNNYVWFASVPNPLTSKIDVVVNSAQGFAVAIDQDHCTLFDTAYVFLANDCDSIIVDTNTVLMPLESYAFSPNGDAVNDVFVLDFLEGLDNTVRIYNRWGDELASFINYNNEDLVWDGTFLGVSVPYGTYYFTISYDNGRTAVGWVQVVR